MIFLTIKPIDAIVFFPNFAFIFFIATMNVLQLLNRSLIINFIANIFLLILWWLPYIINFTEFSLSDISIFGTIRLCNIPLFVLMIMQFAISVVVFFIVSLYFFPRFVEIISYLQFSMMFLLFTFLPATHIFTNSTIAAFMALIALFEITKIDFIKNNTYEVFNAMVLTIVASFFQVDFLLLIPLFAIGVFVLEGIKLRSVVMIAFVVIVSASVVAGYAYFFDSLSNVSNYYKDFLNLKTVTYSICFVFKNSTLFVTLLFATISFFIHSNRESRLSFKTKKIIAFIAVVWSCLTAYMLIFEAKQYVFSIFTLILTALLLLLTFTEYKFRGSNIMFVLFIFLLSISYVLQNLFLTYIT